MYQRYSELSLSFSQASQHSTVWTKCQINPQRIDPHALSQLVLSFVRSHLCYKARQQHQAQRITASVPIEKAHIFCQKLVVSLYRQQKQTHVFPYLPLK